MNRTEINVAIGDRIRTARRAQGWSMAKLGGELTRAMGEKWPSQRVSATERGQRNIAIAELLHLSVILGRPVGWLIEGEREADEDRSQALAGVFARLLSGEDLAFPERLTRALEHLRSAQDELAPVEGLLAFSAQVVRLTEKGENDEAR